MSDDIAISVINVSKAYRIWRDPAARLKAPLWSTWQKFIAKRLKIGANSSKLPAYSLSPYYKDFYALKDVSIEVKKGEALGIIGMNGSGKSTLLQILAGTLSPTNGHASTQGRIAALLELGSGFNPEFSGRENIYLNCAVLGLSKDEIDKRLESIISFSELAEFIDQPVRTYSSGMVVRLAFSAISQVDPDILIVDEALAVGDAYFQHKCVARIRQFKEQGGTLLFVSHDPGAVKLICSRAILLDQGVIIKDGPADSVLDYYNSLIAKKQDGMLIVQQQGEAGKMKTRSGNGKAFIESIVIFDDKERPTLCFTSGARATIRCTVTFNEKIVCPTLGILIRDRLGMDIFGTNTFNQKQPLPETQAGSRLQIDIQIELSLGIGSYSLTAALHSERDHLGESYDWIDHALIFQIIPQNGRNFVGCVSLPCSFSAIKL
ncbi:MAG: ABC transporter ATP-binding protein [Opitutus sp.]|nr:ABC transporter ATP-binding protein [Opitutus sp.]MCS6277742.1 ABC transporter ATP-binding protein [Opitutus sp.]MCS6299153.1 ABC transporter ATP-binding protein [Opitutus sp.]